MNLILTCKNTGSAENIILLVIFFSIRDIMGRNKGS